MHVCARTRARACTHTYRYSYIQLHICTYMYIHTYLFTFFYVSTHIGDVCVCVYVCMYSQLYMYSCACVLSSNRMDLYTVMTCECWHVVRYDSVAVGERGRARGDSAGACWARRVGRGCRQGTLTRACPRIHVLYQACVWDYEDDDDFLFPSLKSVHLIFCSKVFPNTILGSIKTLY